MALPFKTYTQPESELIAGILIPKRGCLTVSEEIAMRDMSATLDEKTKDMTELQADIYLKQRIVTILLKRIDKTWTIEKTEASEWEVTIDGEAQTIEPDMEMLDGLFMFAIGEQRRWRTDEPQTSEAAGNGKKKLTGAKSTGS
ncbi:MAG TPA: hypothetical protein V6D10_07085 [Trichocoleus sp.]|jgi:hypothetical protein